MAAIPVSNLHDPLVRKVVAHVYNKYRADIPNADCSQFIPNKQKFTATQKELMLIYRIDYDHHALKLKKVSGHTRTHTHAGASCRALLTRCCRAAVRAPSPSAIPRAVLPLS